MNQAEGSGRRTDPGIGCGGCGGGWGWKKAGAGRTGVRMGEAAAKPLPPLRLPLPWMLRGGNACCCCGAYGDGWKNVCW